MAKKIPYKYQIHGEEITDNYYWLRDENWPEVSNPEIIEYLEIENKATTDFLESQKSLIDQIFDELKSRIKLTDTSVYTKKGDYFYYSRTEENKNYPIFCRKKLSLSANEEIILDVNKVAEGKKYTQISSLSVSPSQKFIAYTADFSGDEHYSIFAKDLDSGSLLCDEVRPVFGEACWHEDEKGFFYTPVNQHWRHDKVMYHKLGEDPSKDTVIMHEKDPLNQLSISKSSSKEFFFINSSGHDSSRIYYFGMKDESYRPIEILSRKDKIIYNINHSDNYFYIRTNDQGPNFRLAKMNAKYPVLDQLEDHLRYDPNSYLESFSVTSNFLIANYKKNAIPKVVIYDQSTSKHKEIVFPDQVYVASGHSTNFEDDDLRVSYSSLKRPSITYSFRFETGELTILKQDEIPSGFEPEEYELKREWAQREGVKIPITILYKKSLFKGDGSNPLFLTGYGSYGYGYPVSFSNKAISIVNRGFIYAISHIRGGDEFGYDWYESAKFLNKKNTFEDFIASAQFMIDANYSSKQNITISGGSAGGMLVGYAVNNAPELFNAAIADVPFVDVLNTMLDETLPLTPLEFKEWGNPKQKEYFEYIKSYSPYDNIKRQKYPNMFITAGLSDPRVTYWEAAKFTAKLKEYNLGQNKIFLHTNMTAGHAGASGRFNFLKEVAEHIAFAVYFCSRKS
ncbi:MAG: S9 family peptidase [Rickettsiaceae bacterium]|nr:S9 family peptidase [Rickettsiaceae bacterium]